MPNSESEFGNIAQMLRDRRKSEVLVILDECGTECSGKTDTSALTEFLWSEERKR